ncbi:hypothetical protein E3O06_11235 [Cryobacterium glaciale]|uniref:Phosphotyrosine protein phosphatase I domain-containing protein n=1 Tax=Cryobacterium glaciale TaxID=1259145 RepID=A0A4R8UWG0_9MICO|nr:hypothetical protein [Cryobacterium glaciale]TFB71830.1 hypothetical protein E3O06_11235 [Cryobacterium glaciale]
MTEPGGASSRAVASASRRPALAPSAASASPTGLSVPHILIVCTGNICRSPLAEQVLRARLLAAGSGVTVASAGTQAVVGGAMTPEAAALALKLGSASTVHTPRQLTADMLAQADLVLTATRDHRRDVVTLFPKATRYTFTLNQFARLVDAAAESAALAASPSAPSTSAPGPGPETGPTIDHGPGSVTWARAADAPAAQPAASAFAAFVASIAATRGLQPSPTPPTRDDIDDPYRQNASVYSRVAAIIDDSVTTVAAAISTALAAR